MPPPARQSGSFCRPLPTAAIPASRRKVYPDQLHNFRERRVIKRYNVHQLKGSHVSLYRIAHEVKKCHVYNAEEDNEDGIDIVVNS